MPRPKIVSFTKDTKSFEHDMVTCKQCNLLMNTPIMLNKNKKLRQHCFRISFPSINIAFYAYSSPDSAVQHGKRKDVGALLSRLSRRRALACLVQDKQLEIAHAVIY